MLGVFRLSVEALNLFTTYFLGVLRVVLASNWGESRSLVKQFVMPNFKFHAHLNLSGVLCLACAATYVLLGVFVASTAFASEADAAKTPPSKMTVVQDHSAVALEPTTAGTKADDGAAVKDPFSMSAPQASKTRFIPSPQGSSFPKITLRGIVIARDKPQSPIALIEVDGYGTYVVRTDSTISLQKVARNTPDDKSVLRVVTITRQDVTVQMGSLGEKLIVR